MAIIRANQVWATDITYIQLARGFCYLVAIMDWYSRYVIDWQLSENLEIAFCLATLKRALNKRRPEIFNSDQGSQFSSYDWQDFLKAHNLTQSMSRRGNCHDNAVAESFFQLLKRKRIRRKVYLTRDEGKADVFDYIEMFYNPRRRHSSSGRLSPVDYEKQYFERLGGV